ncbi:MAG: gamma-glutamyl-gamma-aminobutyrate hydrolase family protein [Alphaproteobacteria bacterium]|nr:gamma-glutamyl-gamma-aminobutyrate hydrolase family protein [Alphaproteobacteria bacterium]
MTLPVIGLTLDSENNGGYSALPWYALRENYCSAVVQAGGLPFLLPHEPEKVDDYIDHIDGLIVTGGNFDVDPSLFGDKTKHPTVKTKDRRTSFEFKITQKALEKNIPILGICGGQQLLNVVLGGTLIQHIPDEIKNCLQHEQPNPRTEPGHNVSVTSGTLLHKICGQLQFPVNSAHHQAVKSVSSSAVVNALAPDGVIEGIESKNHRFCLGVQWHPEYHISDADNKIFDAFIKAAKN